MKHVMKIILNKLTVGYHKLIPYKISTPYYYYSYFHYPIGLRFW